MPEMPPPVTETIPPKPPSETTTEGAQDFEPDWWDENTDFADALDAVYGTDSFADAHLRMAGELKPTRILELSQLMQSARRNLQDDTVKFDPAEAISLGRLGVGLLENEAARTAPIELQSHRHEIVSSTIGILRVIIEETDGLPSEIADKLPGLLGRLRPRLPKMTGDRFADLIGAPVVEAPTDLVDLSGEGDTFSKNLLTAADAAPVTRELVRVNGYPVPSLLGLPPNEAREQILIEPVPDAIVAAATEIAAKKRTLKPPKGSDPSSAQIASLARYLRFHGSSERRPEALGIVDADLPIIARYVLVNVQGCTTARKLEQIDSALAVMTAGKLKPLFPGLKFPEVVERGIPLVTAGDDPPVRRWLVPDHEGWKSGELPRRAAKWLVEFAAGCIRPDRSVDMAKVRVTEWGSLIKANGLRGALQTKELGGVYGFLKLGLQAHGSDLVYGTGPDEVPPWEFKRPGMWALQEGGIDHLTRYIIKERLPKDHAELFTADGTLDLAKVRDFEGLSAYYDDIAQGSLHYSRIGVAQALARVHPELFGYEKGLIRPWDMRGNSMWVGADGLRLFREGLAVALADAGLGTFDRERSVYRLTSDDLAGAPSTVFDAGWLQKAIAESGVRGGAQRDDIGNSVYRMANALFGLSVEIPADEFVASRAENVMRRVQRVLKAEGDVLEIPIMPIDVWTRLPIIQDESAAIAAALAVPHERFRLPSFDRAKALSGIQSFSKDELIAVVRVVIIDDSAPLDFESLSARTCRRAASPALTPEHVGEALRLTARALFPAFRYPQPLVLELERAIQDILVSGKHSRPGSVDLMAESLRATRKDAPNEGFCSPIEVLNGLLPLTAELLRSQFRFDHPDVPTQQVS